MGVEGAVKEGKQRSALLPTGGGRGPYALAPGAAHRPPRALRDAPLDHYEAQGLLGQVVGRLDPRAVSPILGLPSSPDA